MKRVAKRVKRDTTHLSYQRRQTKKNFCVMMTHYTRFIQSEIHMENRECNRKTQSFFVAKTPFSSPEKSKKQTNSLVAIRRLRGISNSHVTDFLLKIKFHSKWQRTKFHCQVEMKRKFPLPSGGSHLIIYHYHGPTAIFPLLSHITLVKNK